MMYIYTNKDKIPENNRDDLILNADKYFDYMYKSGQKFNTSLCNEIIREIDNAERLFDDVVKTPFGYCDLTHLSSGCKTNLLAVYFGMGKIIPVSLCGANAVHRLIETAKVMDIVIYVPYIFNSYLGEPTDAAYIDNVLYTGSKLWEKIETLNERGSVL